MEAVKSLSHLGEGEGTVLLRECWVTRVLRSFRVRGREAQRLIGTEGVFYLTTFSKVAWGYMLLTSESLFFPPFLACSSRARIFGWRYRYLSTVRPPPLPRASPFLLMLS